MQIGLFLGVLVPPNTPQFLLAAARGAEARGFHMFEAEARSFRVITYAWDAAGLGVVAEREFPRRAIA